MDALFTEMQEIETNIENILKVKDLKFKTELKTLPISSITIQQPLQDARAGTEDGLTSSIELIGVITPLIVMPFEGVEDKYILVDGYRRLFSLTRLKQKEVDVIVVTYDDRRAGKEDAFLLGRILSNSRRLDNNGLWSAVTYLEEIGVTDYAAMDALFGLPGGSIINLKEVMEGEYEEPKESFTEDERDINYSKRQLDKLRKEAKRSENDDAEQREQKTDEEVKEELGVGVVDIMDDEDVSVMLFKEVMHDTDEETILAVAKLPYTNLVLPSDVKVDTDEANMVITETKVTAEEYDDFLIDGLVINDDEEEDDFEDDDDLEPVIDDLEDDEEDDDDFEEDFEVDFEEEDFGHHFDEGSFGGIGLARDFDEE